MSFTQRYLNRHVALELLPAVVFFIANHLFGLTIATIAVMVATVLSLLIGYAVDRKLPLVALATLAIVLLLGSASLALGDDRYIKMKPTVGKCLFAAALFVGLWFRPTMLERALGTILSLTPSGWRMLTFAWIAFALCQAVANELVWRSLDTDAWVTFKTALAPVSIAGYIVIARLMAPRYWQTSGATQF